MDDATITRFQRDTKITVPGSGPEKFAQRAAYLDGEGRAAWLQWRADQLTQFYQKVRKELRAKRPEACVYLAGASLFSGEEASRTLMPALSRRLTLAEMFLRAGLDVNQYRQAEGLVLLRPETMVPEEAVDARAIRSEISQTPDWDRLFIGLPQTGALFYHRPQEVRIASFDEKSPIRPTYTWLATQPVPSGPQNRRRFAHALATLDPQAVFDGGWELSMGQESSLKDLTALYRRLPAVHFEPIAEAETCQPVAIRWASHGDRTWAYVVNDAPFEVSEVRIRVTAPAGTQLEELTAQRRVPPLARDADGAYWQLSLKPYEVVAVAFSSPKVTLSEPKVAWSGTIYTALQKRIAELSDRAAVLRRPPTAAEDISQWRL